MAACEVGRRGIVLEKNSVIIFGGHIMKKIQVALIVVLVLCWSCGVAFCKAEGKDKEGKGKSASAEKQTESVESKSGAKKAAVPKPRGGASREERMRKLRERVKREGGGRELREKGLKGKEKAEAEKSIREKRGRLHERQLGALTKKMAHEEIKHRKRLARLTRIRQLAVSKGNTETVARVDKLIAKQRIRYGRKVRRISIQESRRKGIAERSAAERPAKEIRRNDKKAQAEVKEQIEEKKEEAAEKVEEVKEQAEEKSKEAE